MSKMLISYKNELADASISCESEHPSFPCENIIHRWYKKTYRSKYGDDSGWGLFRVTASNQNIYFTESSSEIVVNGTMESWASATNLNNWSESLAGTSTVNREATIKYAGSYSCRMDIDASNSLASIAQSITMTAGAAYHITLWYRTDAGKGAGLTLCDSTNTVFLKSDSTWNTGTNNIELPPTNGVWTRYALSFSAHASYTNYTLVLKRSTVVSAASSSIYFDNASICSLLTAIITTGDYDADSLCTEAKTQMDAVGSTYTVSYDDATNKFTFTPSSGTIVFVLAMTSNAAWGMFGFTSGVTTIDAASVTSEYMRIHTNELVYFDLGSTKTLRQFMIKYHNLQATASIYVRIYSDAFITQTDSITLTWHEDQIGIRSSKSARYIAFEVRDIDNPDGFIELGLAWAGDAVQLQYGFKPNMEDTPEDPSILSSSEDGQESSIQLSRYNDKAYGFEAVDPLTDRAFLRAAFEEIGKSRPCFVTESPPASGDIGEDAEYVKIIDWKWTKIAGEYWSLSSFTTRSER